MNKDFEKYISRNVWCKTKELAKEFLRLAHDNGWKWKDVGSLLESTSWEAYEKYTCYYVGENKEITYGWIKHQYTNEFIEYEPLCTDKDISPEEKKGENKMTKEEKVKLVFKTISKIVGFEIRPDKDFYVVANRKKVKHHIKSNLTLMCETSKGCYERSLFTILPILKGGFILEEIKEPLTTKEERDFLKQFKFEELAITDKINLYLYDNGMRVAIINLKTLNFGFDGLKDGKRYSKAELGL